VVIIRDKKEREISVLLEGRDEQLAKIERDNSGATKLWGAELKEPSKEVLNKLGIKFGVELTFIGEGKFKDTGISRGFIITYVNQMPIKSIQDLNIIIQRSKRSLLIEGIYPDGKIAYYAMGL
ncbi:MAG: hypothetical protein WC960_05335, partial [Bacteroidales bacterium]